jgi:hypothetical protein
MVYCMNLNLKGIIMSGQLFAQSRAGQRIEGQQQVQYISEYDSLGYAGTREAGVRAHSGGSAWEGSGLTRVKS